MTLARAADGATLAFRGSSAPTSTSGRRLAGSAGMGMAGMMGSAGVELYSVQFSPAPPA